MRQELKTYRQSIIDDYRKEYGEYKGRWKYRYGVPEIIDKANLELKYLWENPS
jgi:hypothetical protein